MSDYLEIPDGVELAVRPYDGWRAKVFIPCTHGRCPGRMQLRFVDKRNRPLDRPYYLCDQDGGPDARWTCPNCEEPTYPEHLRSEYVNSGNRARPGTKSNEALEREEMVTRV